MTVTGCQLTASNSHNRLPDNKCNFQIPLFTCAKLCLHKIVCISFVSYNVLIVSIFFFFIQCLHVFLYCISCCLCFLFVYCSVSNLVLWPKETNKVYLLTFYVGCRQQGHVGSKTLHQQNPPVLNCRCRLMHVDLYNGCKMVTVVVVLTSYTAFCSMSSDSKHLLLV